MLRHGYENRWQVLSVDHDAQMIADYSRGRVMRLSAVENEIAVLQRFKKNQIDLLRNGVRIEDLAGRRIDDLIKEASAARFRLSVRFLQSAKRLVAQRPMLHRDSISRSYYSMYHAARAVVFVAYQGDDYEPHDKLAGGMPADFPDIEQWQNDLKEARLKRNEADYDPFPSGHASFRASSNALFNTATRFSRECLAYLRARGCPL
jgi:uncharacterized protein (UPF0332 family)